jgi:hypothetical protein
VNRNEKGGIALSYCSGEIQYAVYDDSEKLIGGTFNLNQFGAFNLEFQLSENVHIGNASAIFRYQDRSYTHHFKILNFKTPEFEVVSYSLPLRERVCSSKNKLIFTSVVIAVKQQIIFSF